MFRFSTIQNASGSHFWLRTKFPAAILCRRLLADKTGGILPSCLWWLARTLLGPNPPLFDPLSPNAEHHWRRNSIWPQLNRKWSFVGMKASDYHILLLGLYQSFILHHVNVNVYLKIQKDSYFFDACVAIEIPRIRFLNNRDQTIFGEGYHLSYSITHIIWHFHCLFNHMIPCIKWVMISTIINLKYYT